MMCLMTAILAPLIAGAVFLFLGRWMYKNPTKFHANWLYTNPRHPFLLGYARVFATILIFGGSQGVVAALVSQRMPGSLGFFVSIAGGIAGALFLRPRAEKLVSPSTGDTPPTVMPIKQSFLSKKGKWTVAISVGIAFLLSIVVIGSIDNSEVCRFAVQQAQSHSVVGERLGQPIKRGLIVGGSIKMSGSSGSANLEIPLSGPRGSGTVYAVAVRTVGIWKFETLKLAVQGDSNRIDLLDDGIPTR
jgi:hypothetical protein